MNFVGLDLSLRETGWAILDDSREAHGVIKTPNTLRGARRLAYLLEKLEAVMPAGHSVVAVEGYAMGARGNTYDIGEWGGLTKWWLYQRGDCVCLSVPPTNLKQFVTGSGGADKPRMVVAINRLMGTDIKNHNEADAVGLALIARQWYRKTSQTDYEAAAMKKIRPCYPIPFRPKPTRTGGTVRQP